MEIICPKCSYVRKPADRAPDYECPKCGVVYAKFDKTAQDRKLVASARNTGDWSGIDRNQIPPEYIGQASRSLPITTAHHVPGHEIVGLIDVVSAECVFGVNLIKELFAGVTDAVGGRSETIQNTLRDAKQTAMGQLREEAFAMGADAVVAVNLSYSELSGAGKTMLMVIATGTAVTLQAV